ncbi:outer membrane protein [Erythrobacter sp. WG]|uniref:outer membrane protein n=1 Tax=Erythrobacter sp. WG TaxID=2985510 RepID=UPI00226D7F0C|nr:outer membrane beta-barrel protein [Erythrobacter sp. WG]MCX9148468.1 outer membrane beta-barrel protein [Erythrobacter sp. WG]
MSPKYLLPAAGFTALMLSSTANAQQDDRYFDGPYISATVGLESPEASRGDVITFDTNRDGTFTDTVRTGAGVDAFSPGFCSGTPTAAGVASCRGNRQNDGYAVRVGYDRHLGSGPVVAGILLEGARPGVEEFTSGFSTTPASYTFGRELDWAVTARARLGIAPGEGRGLFYVTGGGGYARIDRSFSTSNVANSFTPNDNRSWELGWQAGGGAEVMLTRNLGIGLEYLYSSFDDSDYVVGVGQGTAPATNPFLLQGPGTDLRLSNDRFDYHSFRASVNFRF